MEIFVQLAVGGKIIVWNCEKTFALSTPKNYGTRRALLHVNCTLQSE